MKLIWEKTSFTNKNLIVTGSLIIIAAVVGLLIFFNWQNRTNIIYSTTSSTNQNRLPVSGEREIIKRPTLAQGEPNRIQIPERDIEAPIIYITQEQNNEEGHQEALAKGVVHYPGTALPGEFGNPYIFGHSSDYFWKSGNYKQVFKPLIDIPLDTEIRITDSEGRLFIYRVIETKIVGPKDVSVLDQYDNERQLLTLQTSWPLGTALKRYIVVAAIDEMATYGSVIEQKTL